jgi:hypothetical protein
MKRIMEVNGVANISMLIQCEVDKTDDGRFIMNKETYDSINEQLKLLNKYMKAYNDALNKGEQTPYWHDVRDSK